jgi:anti-sigma B factor antagonist
LIRRQFHADNGKSGIAARPLPGEPDRLEIDPNAISEPSKQKETNFMDMIVEETDGGVTNVILRGRLDTAGADSIDLRFNAVAGAKRAVVVDLSNVNLLTSLGIRVLLLGARAVKSKGGKLVILSPDANVRAVLQAARTDTLIPIFDDRNAAIAAVSPAAG